MDTYQRLVKLIENNVTHLDNLNTEPDTISPTEFNGCNKRKPGRPKVKPQTPVEIILEEYKKLETSYNLLELEYKILKKELEIALNEIDLMKLKDIKNNMNNHMQNK